MGLSIPTYVLELQNYITALENWIDLRAFQDGDDNEPIEIKGTADFSMEITKASEDIVKTLLTQLCMLNEKTVKEFIAHKWPKGIGLYE